MLTYTVNVTRKNSISRKTKVKHPDEAISWLISTGGHGKQDQILLIKMAKHLVF